MTALLAAVAGLLGLAVGSFLNVVIHRVPLKQPVSRPRSRCGACGTPIAPRDNIPVVSWALLRGRCRACAAPIAARYPLVELGTAALFAAAALRLGADWALPAFCVFFAALLAVALVDLEHRTIPNRIVYPTLFTAVPLLTAAAALGGDWARWRDAALGGAAAFAALWVVWFVAPRGMGYGDVRLAGVIGLYLGWLGLGHVLLGLFLGFLLGGVVGAALLASRRRGRKDAVPFGPFLAAGAVLATLWGQPLIDLYLGR
ncbi:MAG: prepilin peptidase [Acidimicrobiales bacterium]